MTTGTRADIQTNSSGETALPRWLAAYRAWRRRHPRRLGAASLIGVVLLAVIVVMCVVVPMVWSYSANAMTSIPSQSPSWSHPFGTDELGRDVFVRVFQGGRIDLCVVVIAVTTSAAIGASIGVTAGVAGRWVDAVLMRVVDAVIAFPFVVLVLAIVLLFGVGTKVGPAPPGLASLLFAYIVVDWSVYARLARGQALSLRQRDFVVAAQILGYSRSRVILRHVLPNVATTIGAYMVTDAVLAITATAALPFLGVGVQPPTAEWGAIMQEGSSLLGNAWWITITPALVLAITGVSLSLIADSILSRQRVG